MVLPCCPGPARCQSLPGAQGERGAANTEKTEEAAEKTAEDAEVAAIIATEEEKTWLKQTGKFWWFLKLRVQNSTKKI